MKIVSSQVRAIVLAVPLVFFIACAPASGTQPPEPPPESHAPAETTVPLGEEFTLSPGDRANLAEKEVTVEFVQVTEDSRCPIGARCIWAGQVTVLLRVTRQGQTVGEPKLTLRVDEGEPASAPIGDLRIRLTSVEPYPEAKPIEPTEYRAKLVVELGK